MLKRILSILVIIFSLFIFSAKSYAVGENGFSWDKKTLSVFIPSDNAYSDMMRRAFQKWQDMSFKQLTFTYVQKLPADIEVVFGDKTDGSDVSDIGEYTLTIKGGSIANAEIVIVPDSQKYSQNMIFTVMLHEVGHALGLTDSRRNLGIMHSPVDEKQDIISNDIIKLFRLNGWSYMNKGTYSQF